MGLLPINECKVKSDQMMGQQGQQAGHPYRLHQAGIQGYQEYILIVGAPGCLTLYVHLNQVWVLDKGCRMYSRYYNPVNSLKVKYN